MTDPGSGLRDLFYSRAESVDLSPALPADVRRKVRRLRRFDALLVGIALVLVVAGAMVLLDRPLATSLPPARPDESRLEAARSESPLEAGVSYSSSALGGVRFSIDTQIAATHVHIQSRRLLGLHTTGHDGITIREVHRVHDPDTGKKVPAPDDLVGWLMDHPGITATDAGTIEIDGETAHTVVVTDAQVPPVGEACREGLLEPLPCLPLFASRELGGYARAGDLIRIHVFEHGGQIYSAEAYGTKARPDLAERWDGLLRSLRFED